VWTGEYDLNTLHGDGELFESGKKSGIQNYMDSYGRGHNLPNMLQKNALFITVFKISSAGFYYEKEWAEDKEIMKKTLPSAVDNVDSMRPEFQHTEL